MGEIQGKISGIGNKATRLNEITADDLATLRHFQIGWDYGVVNRQGYNFIVDTEKHKGTSSVQVGKGIMFAYGYVGYADNSVFEFIRPAIPQYHIIYAELDRSKIPNTCILKVKNNQSSTNIERTFRQDYLDKVRTGIFQLPIWRIKVGSNGIEEVFDLRVDLDLLKPSIKQVEYAPNCNSVFGSIDETVSATTQPYEDSSEKIATALFVRNATRFAIDNEQWVKVEFMYNSSRGAVSPSELKFTNENYQNPQQIQVTANTNYSFSEFSGDSNVVIESVGNGIYNVSLLKFDVFNTYSINAIFVH